MRKLILLSLTLLMLPFMFSSNLYAIDSIGYRYYHDMDNEREGSKYRAYLDSISINSSLLMKEKELEEA